MSTHNTRGGIEEKYDRLVLELMGQSAFSAYVGSFHHAKIKDFIHQELQKAREEERERVIDLLVEEGYLKGRELIPHDESKKSHGTCCYCGTCGHGNDDCVCEHNRLLQTIRDRYQSELEQPTDDEEEWVDPIN